MQQYTMIFSIKILDLETTRGLGQAQERVPRQWNNKKDEGVEFEKRIWGNQNEGVWNSRGVFGQTF